MPSTGQTNLDVACVSVTVVAPAVTVAVSVIVVAPAVTVVVSVTVAPPAVTVLVSVTVVSPPPQAARRTVEPMAVPPTSRLASFRNSRLVFPPDPFFFF